MPVNHVLLERIQLSADTASVLIDNIPQTGYTDLKLVATARSTRSGGVTTDEIRVAFKPVATLIQSQDSINNEGEKVELKGKGRHDACVVPRAVPIVEAMAAIVILDMYLRNKATAI